MSEANKKQNPDMLIIKALAIGIGFGLCFLILILLLCSFLVLKQVLPMSAGYLIASVAGAAGSGAAGFISARLKGNKGFFVGLICGILFSFIIMFVNDMIFGFSMDYTVIFKLAAFIAAGIIGGILGINGKYKR